MKAYRRLVVIKDPKRVVLADVPFEAGERVEVLMLSPDDARASLQVDVKTLLRATQTLPSVQALSDSDIIAEIAAYWSGQGESLSTPTLSYPLR